MICCGGRQVLQLQGLASNWREQIRVKRRFDQKDSHRYPPRPGRRVGSGAPICVMQPPCHPYGSNLFLEKELGSVPVVGSNELPQ
jgi:hypothetical protein